MPKGYGWAKVEESGSGLKRREFRGVKGCESGAAARESPRGTPGVPGLCADGPPAARRAGFRRVSTPHAVDERVPAQHEGYEPGIAVVERPGLEGEIVEGGPALRVPQHLERDLVSEIGRAADAGTAITHGVEKPILLAEVWRQPYGGSEKTVDVHLSWLRKKLGESAADSRYLQTVRGVGIKIVEPA